MDSCRLCIGLYLCLISLVNLISLEYLRRNSETSPSHIPQRTIAVHYSPVYCRFLTSRSTTWIFGSQSPSLQHHMGCLPLPALALVQPTNAQLTQIGLTGAQCTDCHEMQQLTTTVGVAGVRVARITGSAKQIAATTTQCQGPQMEPVQKAVCVQPSVFAASTGHLLVGVRALHSVALAAVLWASALLPTPVRILVLGYLWPNEAQQLTHMAGGGPTRRLCMRDGGRMRNRVL